MSKKNKKQMNVIEAVGDTSGFSEQAPEFNKGRKVKLYVGLAAIVILLVFSIIFFTASVKVEFNYKDGATQTKRYVVSKSTKTLTDGPSDPTRDGYDFGGWYFDASCKKGGLFNNSLDNSLLTYNKFSNFKTTQLIARWDPHKYSVTYDVKGNLVANSQVVSNLEKENLKVNPSYYTIKHTPLEYEINDYAEELIKSDPVKYGSDKNASTNVNNQIDIYTNECQLSSITLKDISVSGWTFLGWFDENGNKVETLDKLNPQDIKLTAKWQKN